MSLLKIPAHSQKPNPKQNVILYIPQIDLHIHTIGISNPLELTTFLNREDKTQSAF